MKTYGLSLLLILMGMTKSFGETSPRLIEPITDDFFYENACDTILIDQDGVPVRIIGSVDKIKGTRLRIKSCDGKITQFYDHEKVISLNGVPFSSWLADYLPKNVCDTILVNKKGGPVKIIGRLENLTGSRLRIKSCGGTTIQYYNHEKIISLNGIPFATWLNSQLPENKHFVKVKLREGNEYEGEVLSETDEKISICTYEGDSLDILPEEITNILPIEYVLLVVNKKNQKIKRIIRNGDGTGFWLKESLKMKKGVLQNINPLSLDVGTNTYLLHQFDSFSNKNYNGDRRVIFSLLGGLIFIGSSILWLIAWWDSYNGGEDAKLRRWPAYATGMVFSFALFWLSIKLTNKKHNFIAAPKDQNWEKGMLYKQID
ncbi:MAG: hypothetical protein AAF388_26780 [Bacteroidota bacterium]